MAEMDYFWSYSFYFSYLTLNTFESPLSKYGEIALNWAGDNELLVSLVVIVALTADVICRYLMG